jgi:hypothetical protein
MAASAMSCARCYGSRKVEVPRLAGQILDKRTGKPIEDMVVYQSYGTFNRMMAGTHEGGGQRDYRWTITDAEGRFEFPAHVVAEALKNYVDIKPKPSILLLHRDYGRPLVYVPEDRSRWEQIVWEVEPAAQSLRDIAQRCSSVCDLEGEAYADCCTRLCGPLERCTWHLQIERHR